MKKLFLTIACCFSVATQSDIIAMDNFVKELKRGVIRDFNLKLNTVSERPELYQDDESLYDFGVISGVIPNLFAIRDELSKEAYDTCNEVEKLCEEVSQKAKGLGIYIDKRYCSWNTEYFSDFLRKYNCEDILEKIKAIDEKNVKKCIEFLDSVFKNHKNAEKWNTLRPEILECGSLYRRREDGSLLNLYELLDETEQTELDQNVEEMKEKSIEGIDFFAILKKFQNKDKELFEFMGDYFSTDSLRILDSYRMLSIYYNEIEKAGLDTCPDLKNIYEQWKEKRLRYEELVCLKDFIDGISKHYNETEASKKNIQSYVQKKLQKSSRPLTEQEEEKISSLKETWEASDKKFRMVTLETLIDSFNLSSDLKNYYINLLKQGSLSDVCGEIDRLIDSGKIKFDEDSFSSALKKLRDIRPILYNYLDSLKTETTSPFAEFTRRLLKKAAEIPVYRDVLIILGAWLNVDVLTAKDVQERFINSESASDTTNIKKGRTITLICGDETNKETYSRCEGQTIRVDFFNKLFGYNLSYDSSAKYAPYRIDTISVLLHEIGHMVFSDTLDYTMEDAFSWKLMDKMYLITRDTSLDEENIRTLEKLGKADLNEILSTFRRYTNNAEESYARDILSSLITTNTKYIEKIRWSSFFELWQIAGVFSYNDTVYINLNSDFVASLQRKTPVRIDHLGGVVGFSSRGQLYDFAKALQKFEIKNPISSFSLKTEYWEKWMNFFGTNASEYQRNIDTSVYLETDYNEEWANFFGPSVNESQGNIDSSNIWKQMQIINYLLSHKNTNEA